MTKFGRIYSAAASLVVLALFLLLVFLRSVPSEAIVGLLGVLIGSLVSSLVQYAISESNMRQQLRLAALDKRLQVAQEAMTLWHRLRVVDPDGSQVVLQECKHWWDTNSLYLTAEARKAFKDAYQAAGQLHVARARHADWDEMQALSNQIEGAAAIIAESVYLPPISELDGARPKTQSSNKDA